MQGHGTIVIFLGPPGCGKGTQAARLSEVLAIPAISTGEILRRACASGSELGRAVQNVLDSGLLVSDELINQVVAERLLEEDCEGGCILDGYPRTAAQARYLSELLERRGMQQPLVFDFRLTIREIVGRLTRRRQCPQCGRIVSSDSRTRAAQLSCGADGSPLIQRADDRPGVIRARLRIYRTHEKELVRYYRGSRYRAVAAMGTPEKIAGDLLELIGRPWPKASIPIVSAIGANAAYQT